jgi:hypothetical protein
MDGLKAWMRVKDLIEHEMSALVNQELQPRTGQKLGDVRFCMLFRPGRTIGVGLLPENGQRGEECHTKGNGRRDRAEHYGDGGGGPWTT